MVPAAYTPPTGANRKNAAAIPRHYQNLSKKAQQAKVDRQKQQQDQQQRDQGSNETSGSKDSDSASDRSKSEFDQEDESADQKSQGTQLGAQYSTLPSLPALSPPTPNIQVPTAPQYLSQAGPSLARSTSHSMVLVTPDESSVSIPPPKLTTKSNSSPFLTNHSQSVYSHLIPEKSMHPNGQYSNYESNSQSRHLAPQYSTQLATPSDVDSVRATIPSSGATSGQFAWQQQSGSYNTNSVASSVPIVATDRQLGQLHLGNSEGNMGSTESGVSQNNPYVNVSAASAAVSFAVPKPTRSSKDYFDGIVLSDKSAQPAMEVGSITASGDVSLDPALSSQNEGAVQRPVFTMPFGNSKAEQLSSESTTTETWQRW
ncbi:hypothetical protein QFC19_003561 [Naganishia cerealis]|uniref:Uncharacterized protein n=1 Tax=Naganishia cerealis TaxID=610337 RepID=A0ACC2W1H6_9TREE|nr:hypothetical protein QFC19_003561 [Naganishia cerealis]